MKRLLLILILTLSFQSLTKADDISDFQIEGMSIGDSILDFFNKNEIKKNTWDYFKNKEFTPLQFDAPNFAKIYDAIDIQYKTADNNFIIMGLSGIIFYTDKRKINDCYKKMDTVISDIRASFKNLTETPKSTYVHDGINDGGKSKVTGANFEFENSDAIQIQCYDYSKESERQNHLRIGVNTSEYRFFLSNKAYK